VDPKKVLPSRRLGAIGLALMAFLGLAGCGPVPDSASATGSLSGSPASSAAAPGGFESITAAPAHSDTAPSGEWLTYHADGARDAVAGPSPSLDPLRLAWRNRLDGSAVYGQALVADGMVFVGTEGDHLYALRATSGRVAWQASLGAPLRNVSHWAGCGDIDPLGVTSTPVIDLATQTVWVAAEVSSKGRPPVEHELFGFDLRSGRLLHKVDVDPDLPPGESAVNLQQRAALAQGNGYVYVAFGGLAGDCGDYHGWVVGVPESGIGPKVQFDVTPQSSGGAIWDGGGGPSIGASGDLYITTGNPNSPGPAPWAEAVVKLSPNLATPPLAVFQDRRASGDEDLGTGDALLLPGNRLFTVGKTDVGYLLRRSDLTQVHAIAGKICGSDPDGGGAWVASTESVYVPCRRGGIQQVNLATMATGWRSGDVNGAPIVVNGRLWALRYNAPGLEELNPLNGRVLQSVDLAGLGVKAIPTFASPSAAEGLLLVGTSSGVVALEGLGGS